MNHSSGGTSHAGPQRVEGPGRHGSLAAATPAGQLGLDQPAAAPAHGVGPDVEAGTLRQGRERALAEGADARGEPEQRRGVERDAQARRLRGPGRRRTVLRW